MADKHAQLLARELKKGSAELVALGANSRDVMGLIISGAMRLVVLGAVVGAHPSQQ